MKKVLPIIALLWAFHSNAQIDSNHIKLAGQEFAKFNKEHMMGVCIGIGGVVISGIGLATSTGKDAHPEVPATLGGIVCIVGLILDIDSYRHIGLAAKYLQGNSIIIPIPKRKPKWESRVK